MTEYRPIQNAEGYWVGDNGVVITVWEKKPGSRKRRGHQRVLPGCPDSQGYLEVHINRVTRKIHRLVLETFVGPCPKGMACRHLDGNPSNNNLSNLCWGTYRENWEDKVRHGRDNVGHNNGEVNGRSKLTEDDVREIRRTYRKGLGGQMGRKYGVDRVTIRAVAIGKLWSHIPLEK